MEKITYGINLLPNKRNTPYPIYINVRCRALNVYCRFATGLKIHPSIWNITTKRGVMCSYINGDTVFELNYKLNCICIAIEHQIKELYKKEYIFNDSVLLKNELQKFYFIIKENAQKLPTFAKTSTISEEVVAPSPKVNLMAKKKDNITKYDVIKDLTKYTIESKRKKDTSPSRDDAKYKYGDDWSTCKYLTIFFDTYGNKQYKNLELLATTQGVKAFQTFLCDEIKCGKALSATTVNKYINTLVKLLKYYYCQEKNILKKSTILDIDVKKLENNTDQKGNEIALTVNELWQIYKYSPQNKKEEIAKDTLLFLCCSSVRVSDSENMLDTTLHEFAQKKTVKRQTRTFIFDWAEEIITKWQNRSEKPIISKKKGELVKTMKQVAKNAGVNGKHLQIKQRAGKKAESIYVERCELIGTHTGRRTFATLCWLMGMPIAKIGEYTMQTEKMVKHYIKATQKDKDDFEEDVINGCITLPPYKEKYFKGGINGGVANYMVEKEQEKKQPQITSQPQTIDKELIIREYEKQKAKEEEIKRLNDKQEYIAERGTLEKEKYNALTKLLKSGVGYEEATTRIENAFNKYLFFRQRERTYKEKGETARATAYKKFYTNYCNNILNGMSVEDAEKQGEEDYKNMVRRLNN